MKRWMSLPLLVLLLLATGSCRRSADPLPGGGVSLIRLIASPEKYDEKNVTVIGYLSLRFEGTAIFLHESDYEKYVLPNAIFVQFGRKEPPAAVRALEGHCVLLEGRFDADAPGHLGAYVGTISDLSRIVPWPPEMITKPVDLGAVK